ncbi:MAG: SdpI family protein [Anaerovoracaceae bacterium]
MTFICILLANMIAAFIIYPKMPEMVPIHWNIQGEIDNYASKTFGTFFLPILNIAMYFLFLLLPKLDPKRANYERFTKSYKLIRYTIHIYMSLMFVVTVYAGMGHSIDIGFWITIGISLLIIILGIVIGRVKHNYFVGFKLPWTLANEEVWDKTHRIGSKLMVVGGIIALAFAFLTENQTRFYSLMACIFIPLIITAVYSYMIYKKIV